MKKFLLKTKGIIAVILVFVILSFVYAEIVKKVGLNYNGITIVLDAGHGGRDGGSVGTNGTIEKNINLEYVLILKNKLTDCGYKVVLTRKDDAGLYSPLAENKKISDMNKRMEIIKKANPNLVISIHMNSFNDSSVNGATTYHKIDDEASIICATLIQKSLMTYCHAKNSLSKDGDYFMLNCSYYTSVLIECGFLSNPEEEKMLNTDEYRKKFADAVCRGVLLYFGNETI